MWQIVPLSLITVCFFKAIQSGACGGNLKIKQNSKIKSILRGLLCSCQGFAAIKSPYQLTERDFMVGKQRRERGASARLSDRLIAVK